MATLGSVTYTFSNATTADAGEVNTNFTDIINATEDGTVDFNINALTCAGTATLNGNVNLGNSGADDLVITASLAADLPLKTDGTYDIGSAAKGLAICYFGDGGGNTIGLQAPAISANVVFSLPPTDGGVNHCLTTDGSTSLSFSSKLDIGRVTKTANYTITSDDDLISCDASGGSFTVTLPTASGIAGRQYKILRTDQTFNTTVTVDGNASETINGTASFILCTQYESITIMSDGTNWVVLTHGYDTSVQTYTPSTNGFGTISTVQMYWRREGACVCIWGKFTAGTVAASEARVNLPDDGSNVLTSQAFSSIVISGVNVSNDVDGGSSVNVFYSLAEPSQSYITFGYRNAASAPLTKLNGNGLMASSTVLAIAPSYIPILNWK